MSLSSSSTDISGLSDRSQVGGGGNVNGYRKDQTTKSYLGDGVLKDSIVDGSVNQDDAGSLADSFDTTQEITFDKGYDVGVRSDDIQMVMDPDGYIKKTAHDISGLLKTGKAVARVGDAVSDVGDALGAEGVDTLQDYRNSTSFNQATLDFQRDNPELAKVLNNKEKNGADKYQEALGKYTNYVQSQMGNEVANTYLYDSSMLRKDQMVDSKGTPKNGNGMTDMKTRDVYINIDKTDMTNTKDLIGLAGHENIHAGGERSDAVAERGRTQAETAWTRENQYNGNTTGGGYESKSEWNNDNSNSSVVRIGTAKGVSSEDVEADWIEAQGDYKRISSSEMKNGAKAALKSAGHMYGKGIQRIPPPVLSGAGFLAGGAAALGSGGTIPFAMGVSYAVMGLSLTKTSLDYREGKISGVEGFAEAGLEFGGNIPYLGHLVDGGSFLYDSIKYNYQSGNRLNTSFKLEDPQYLKFNNGNMNDVGE